MQFPKSEGGDITSEQYFNKSIPTKISSNKSGFLWENISLNSEDQFDKNRNEENFTFDFRNLQFQCRRRLVEN